MARLPPHKPWRRRAAIIEILRSAVLFTVLLLAGPAGAADAPGESEEGTPNKVARIHFRGNRKVEDEAIRVNLTTQVGEPFSGAKLREDVRAIWKMGFFEDVQIDVSDTKQGFVIVYVVKEKPSIHKILVSGNKEVELSKINEVLDLKRDSILDVAKVKKNVEKVHDLYIDKGFYLAEVDYEVKPQGPNEVDVVFKVDERAKVEIRRVNF